MVCEGLSERKKPRKPNESRRSSEDHRSHSIYSAFPSPSTTASRTAPGTRNGSVEARSNNPSPIDQMHALEALLQNGSAYGGNLSTASGHTQLAQARAFDRSTSYDSGYIGNDESLVASPAAADSGEWNFFGQRDLQGNRENAAINTSMSPTTRRGSAISPHSPTDWSGSTQKPMIWSNEANAGTASLNLISTAQALEQQAHNLRILASQRDTDQNFTHGHRHSIGSLEPGSGGDSFEQYQLDNFNDTSAFNNERNVPFPLLSEQSFWNGYSCEATSEMRLQQSPTALRHAAENVNASRQANQAVAWSANQDPTFLRQRGAMAAASMENQQRIARGLRFRAAERYPHQSHRG